MTRPSGVPATGSVNDARLPQLDQLLGQIETSLATIAASAVRGGGDAIVTQANVLHGDLRRMIPLAVGLLRDGAMPAPVRHRCRSLQVVIQAQREALARAKAGHDRAAMALFGNASPTYAAQGGARPGRPGPRGYA